MTNATTIVEAAPKAKPPRLNRRVESPEDGKARRLRPEESPEGRDEAPTPGDGLDPDPDGGRQEPAPSRASATTTSRSMKKSKTVGAYLDKFEKGDERDKPRSGSGTPSATAGSNSFRGRSKVFKVGSKVRLQDQEEVGTILAFDKDGNARGQSR